MKEKPQKKRMRRFADTLLFLGNYSEEQIIIDTGP